MAPIPAKNRSPVNGRGHAGSPQPQLVAQIIAEALRHVRAGESAEAAACLCAQGGIALGDDFACNLLGLIQASLGEDENALAVRSIAP